MPLIHLGTILLVVCASIVFELSFRPQVTCQCQNNNSNVNETTANWTSSHRQRLNTIRDSDTLPHSKTLGVFDRIYVINLAARDDRRSVMTDLERAMDIEFMWYNATFYEDEVVTRIMSRLRKWRIENRVNSEEVGEVGEASGPTEDPNRPYVFRWSADILEEGPLLGLREADLWSVFEKGDEDLKLGSASTTTNSVQQAISIMDAYGEDGLHFGKIPIRSSQVACWHSHYNLLRQVAEGDDEIVLILEDDVDMEWDLERRLRTMWPFLPEDWDIVLLGHCMSLEFKKPLQGTATLFPATQSLCSHAYAVNRRSASRLIRYLRSESFAYSRAIDHAMNHLSVSGKLKVYTVNPPVIVQPKELASDLVHRGFKPVREQWLSDSALERVALERAQWR